MINVLEGRKGSSYSNLSKRASFFCIVYVENQKSKIIAQYML